ncbi:SGNH/GDSL hydrolase family protein [Microbacterium sp. No. 7]|uniref:SGNH/GDSL hydrolase family protein n=1 Tax=Microbacterium sp. No. 7 TaxID=1714373 RepID=UPI0006ECF7A4|nr:GDSL-type esterase/lipase family protein [Microbacterium sp. No. 7]ALJ19762.1 hypothetical protein AOA12_07525 [Microbacterium sp. No. 7]
MSTVKRRTGSIAAALVSALLVVGLLPAGVDAAAAIPASAPAVQRVARAAALPLSSPIDQLWLRNQPQFGAPLARGLCFANGACARRFQDGVITWAPAIGVGIVPEGAVHRQYEAMGGAGGVLGPAVDRRLRELPDGGAWQRFAGGGVFQRPDATEAHAVLGDVWAAWSQAGREHGALGYPLKNEYTIAGGTAQDFERGRILWSPATGAHALVGGMLSSWSDRGGERSWLGFPVGEEHEVPGGVSQVFQGGELYWHLATQQVVGVAAGGIRDRYHEYAGQYGPLGLPTGEKTAYADGFLQRFEGGAIVWGPRTGAATITHRALDAWLQDPAGYGWPTQDSVADPARGSIDTFENRQVITFDDRLWSAEPVDEGTAILICDSQCQLDSWVEQGVRAAGYPHVVERAFGGGGYGASSSALGSSVPQALRTDGFLLPQGSPGLVVVTLGGNDASQGISDGVIGDEERALVEMLRARYPDAELVVNGVMSRSSADHQRRRAVDALVVRTAQELGVHAISVAGWASAHGAAYLDGVHLSQAGHDTIGAAYAEALRAALGNIG